MAASALSRAVLGLSAASRAGARFVSSSAAASAGIKVEVPGTTTQSSDDVHVSVTLVNTAGERVRIPARVGRTLTQAAVAYGYTDLRCPCEGTSPTVKQHSTAGGWEEPTFGEGAYCSQCLVVMPEALAKDLPRIVDDEEQRLADHPFRDEIGSSSRLGCKVHITPSMEGMVVFVPDGAEPESR